jgi:hypothetical protein
MLLAMFLAACGSSPANPGPDATIPAGPDAHGTDAANSAPDATTPLADASPAGADASPYALDFLVVEQPPGPIDGGLPPVPGVAVAADLPGGAHVESTTGADGIVHFDGVDFSKGTMTVTAWKNGYVAESYLNGTEEWVKKWGSVMVIYPKAGPTELKVSGAIKNLHGPKDNVGIGSTGTTNFLNLTGPKSYTFSSRIREHFTMVAVDETFALTGRDLAMPILGWARIDHNAIAAPTTIDIDFVANKAVPVTAHTTWTLPTRADSPIRTGTTAILNTYNGNDCDGFTTASKVSTSGDQIDVDHEHLDLSDVAPTETYYILRTMPSEYPFSQTQRHGAPVDGTVIDGFLDTPDITQPTDLVTPAPIKDPITWKKYDDDTSGGLTLVDMSGPVFYILVENHTDTTITIPALPKAADPAIVLGTDPLSAYLSLRGDWDPSSVMYLKASCTAAFQIQP